LKSNKRFRKTRSLSYAKRGGGQTVSRIYKKVTGRSPTSSWDEEEEIQEEIERQIEKTADKEREAKGDICPICLDSKDMDNENRMVTTHCGHKIHKTCLRALCSTEQVTNCPMCKADITDDCNTMWGTDKCPICWEYEDMDNENRTITTQCGHKFHNWCLRDWCNENYDPKCPMCVRDITDECMYLLYWKTSGNGTVATRVRRGDKSNLNNVNLRYIIMQDTYLRKGDLRNSNLDHARLEGTDLRNAKMQKAILTHSELEDTKFKNANLQGVDFSNANLKNTDLKNSKLQDAIFENAILDGADFTGANIDGADFSSAKKMTTAIFGNNKGNPIGLIPHKITTNRSSNPLGGSSGQRKNKKTIRKTKKKVSKKTCKSKSKSKSLQ